MGFNLFAFSRNIAILVLLLLFSALATNLTSPVWPIYVRELGASMTELGFVTGLSNAVGAIIQIPSGLVSDRYGRRRIHFLGTVAAAFPPVLYTIARSWADLIPWVLLAGVGIGLTTPIRLAIVADESGTTQRARAYSWFNVAFLIGPTIGPSIGGLVADTYGIRASFLLAGFFMAFSSALAFILGETRKPSGIPGVGVPRLSLSTAATRLIAVFSVNAAQGAAMGLFTTVTPVFLTTRFSMDLTLVGFIYAVGLGLFPLLSQIPGGYLADRFDQRSLMVVMLVASAPFFALVSSSRNVFELISYVSLANAILAFSWPALSALQVAVVPSDLWGFVNGVATSGWWTGMMAGSMLSGIMWDTTGMGTPYYATAVATIASAIPALMLKPCSQPSDPDR
ncbi:MAG: MFS transporter [Candidatus Bathyarchaeia archaeon]